MSNCIKNKRKLIKGQHPLKNCTFYLDIEKHSASEQIEEKINDLGGKIEFFFSESITHVVTDRNTNKEVVANSFNSQLSPGECLTKTNEIRTRSRADEMLQRVRSASQIQQSYNNDTFIIQQDSPINNLLINNQFNIKSPSIQQQQQQIKFNLKETRIWNANHALNILNKLINEKKQRQEEKSSVIKILQNSSNSTATNKSSKSLKDSFIKIESFEKIYRPYYKTFIKWPKINIKLNKTSSLFSYMDNNCLNKLIYQHEKNFQNEKSEQNRKQEEDDNINLLKKQNFEEIKTEINTNNCNNNKIIINSDKIISVAKNGLRKNNNKNFSPPALSAAAAAANYNEGGEKFLLQQINDEKLLIRDKSVGGNCTENKSRNNSFNNLNKTFTSTINDNLKNNKCGFCELCKIEYENLNKHLKSDEHVKFSENSKNYSELDKIILDSGLSLEAFKKKEEEELKSFLLINNNTSSNNISQTNITKANQYRQIKDEIQTCDYTANLFEEASESLQKGLKHKIIRFTQNIKSSHEQNLLKSEQERNNFEKRIKVDCSPIRNSPEKFFLQENLQSDSEEEIKLKEERGQSIHSAVATCTSTSTSTTQQHNHIKLNCNNFFLESNPIYTDNIHPNLKRRENFSKNPAIKLKNCRVNLTRKLEKVNIFEYSPTLEIQFNSESLDSKLETKLANSNIDTGSSTIQETKSLRTTRKNKEPKFYLEYSSSDEQPFRKIKKTNNKSAARKVTNNIDNSTNNNKNCFKMTKFNGASKRLPRKSPLKAVGDEKIMFGDDLCIKNGYRETRQSICKRNSYSVDSIKKVDVSVKQKLNALSSPKSPPVSFITTRPKKSPSKKISYCEVDDDIEDFIIGSNARTKSSITSAVHTKIFTKRRRRKKQEPRKIMKAKRNNSSNNAYYKVVNNKNSPSKRSLDSVVKSPTKKEVNFSTKLGIVEHQADSKLNEEKKPSIIVKFKKIRKSELSILNGEAENFMFPKRMERKRKHSSSADASSDEEILPLPSKRIYGKSPKINNIPTAAVISPNKNRSIIQFSSTTSEKKPFVPKLRSNFLSGDIAKFNFAFERVPKDELWYSVFERQDVHKEIVFEYYGNTKYRKLPFEMGPVSALESRNHCFACTLAQSSGTTKKSKTKNVTSTISSEMQEVKCKSEIEDNDEKSISINSVDNEIFKSKSTKSTIKKLLKRDSTKSILESFDIPRKSPREHASTLAILSCLINNKFSDTDENSGSHSLVNANVSCSSNNKSPKSIPESQILDYKRKSKKTLKLATAILQKTIKSEVSPSIEKKIDNESAMANKANTTQDTSLLLPRRKSKLNSIANTTAISKLATNRSKKPLHWKKRACLQQNLHDVQNKEIYANPIKLNEEIDTFLDTTLKEESFEMSPLPSMVSSNEINFRNMLSLDDLMNDSLLKQQASYFNKLNFVKKRKRYKNNNTGWPKNKKKIVTRQQKRKSSHSLETEKSLNKNIIVDNEKIVNCVSVPEENEEIIENFEEYSEDNVTTLFDDDTIKNEEFLSAESNLEDEDNSIPSTPDEVCKACELYVCECDSIQKSPIAPVTSDIPNKLEKIGSPSSSIKISPRKLRKPRGRWYRER